MGKVSTAQDYPVYFGYGATTPPYSKAHPHRGDDRCNAWGVPVAVEGVPIGKVGSTGLVYDGEGNKGTKAAAHLHMQEWQNSVANTRKPQNSFRSGTVTAVSYSNDFGNYVTITKDGWNTTYCHLSEVSVRVGQVIGGNMPTPVDININRMIHTEMEGWPYHETHAGKFDHIIGPAWNGQNVEDMLWSKWYQDGAFREARERNRIFYEQYASVIGELSARPTKAELDAALAKLQDAADAAQKANEKADKAQAEAVEAVQAKATLEKEKQAADETGKNIMRWLSDMYNKLFGGKNG